MEELLKALEQGEGEKEGGSGKKNKSGTSEDEDEVIQELLKSVKDKVGVEEEEDNDTGTGFQRVIRTMPFLVF